MSDDDEKKIDPGQSSSCAAKSPLEDQDDVTHNQKHFSGLGNCKWFDKGFGFVTIDTCHHEQGNEQRDVFVHQSVIQMPRHRSLYEGERVKIEYKQSPLGWEASLVCGPNGEDCIGIKRRSKRRKGVTCTGRKRRPDRCFNCNEVGHHAKECKCPPLPKRCYCCESVEHLIAICPNNHKPPCDC